MLGFLSNLRDVKSALSAGMLLLFAIWLLVGDEIARVEAGDTLTGRVAILIGYLGPVATLALITFAAYVIGLVLSLHSKVLAVINRHNGVEAVLEEDSLGADALQESRLLNFLKDQVTKAVKKREVDQLAWDLMGEFPGLWRLHFRPKWWTRCLPRWVRRRFTRTKFKPDDLLKDEKSDTEDNQLGPREAKQKMKKQLAYVLFRRIYVESALLAVDLGQKDDQAYERFDKARGESEFRAGLCIPMLVVTGVSVWQLACENYPFWMVWGMGVLGLFAVVVLARRAIHKAQEAQEEVNSAIILGHVELPELQVLDAAINSCTPDQCDTSPSASAPRRRGRILKALLSGE